MGGGRSAAAILLVTMSVTRCDATIPCTAARGRELDKALGPRPSVTLRHAGVLSSHTGQRSEAEGTEAQEGNTTVS